MTKMTRSMSLKGSRTRLAVLLAVTSCVGFAFVFDLRPASFASSVKNADVPNEPAVGLTEPQNYSRFRHDVSEHTRLPCLLCHKRDDNSPSMKFSGHLPCAGCHVQQFADNKNPICSICHTETGVKRFPPLRSFNVKFSHSMHGRQANCATCHKPSRRGVAFSIPAGVNGHVTCFQCHKPEAEIGGRNIGSCNVCHQTGRPPGNSDWARAFTVNFKHSEHGPSRKLNCASCHSAPPGREMTAPLASMHFAPKGVKSCGACHDNSRAFGGTDFSDCKRCHEGGTFKF